MSSSGQRKAPSDLPSSSRRSACGALRPSARLWRTAPAHQCPVHTEAVTTTWAVEDHDSAPRRPQVDVTVRALLTALGVLTVVSVAVALWVGNQRPYQLHAPGLLLNATAGLCLLSSAGALGGRHGRAAWVIAIGAVCVLAAKVSAVLGRGLFEDGAEQLFTVDGLTVAGLLGLLTLTGVLLLHPSVRRGRRPAQVQVQA